MKNIILASAIFAIAPAVAAAADITSLEQPICQWFAAGLTGAPAAPFSPDLKLKPDQIKPAAETVWRAWVEASNSLNEQKLPAMKPLVQADTTSWLIPAELEADATMSFFYGSKGDSRPEAGYPLFLYIHGSGEPEREWATGLKICSNFDDAPSVYFIPRIPNTGELYRWWQRGKQWSWEKMLRQALTSGEIDPNRVYFFGISEGGYGSQRLASFYADYLAGAGPMAGGEPLKNAPAENCRNIAFSLRTGDQDFGFYREKLTRYVKAEFDSLQARYPGYFKNWIDLIPGKGHHIDYSPTTPWLKQNVRNPYPKVVSWEDFEMDGRHRTGFYNLQVIDAPHNHAEGIERTRYEMTIADNRVDLSVDLVGYTTTETDQRWGIALKFDRSYTAATEGVVKIYLNNELVNLAKPVEIYVNGKRAFKGKLKPTLDNLVESCAEYGDPMRLYPASATVDLSKLK